MTTTADQPVTTRLLAGVGGPHHRIGLVQHLALHGRLMLPARSDTRWSKEFIDLVSASGLTGRGGAAFPTAGKLRWIRAQRRRPVVAVNAMEGEPASCKDEVLATLVPHLVLDGAAAVARCVDARAVYVCVPIGLDRAAASIAEALRERSGSDIDVVHVEVVRPPHRFIAGEESALAHWLDGGAALPRFRPERPAVLPVGGRPCLVENAETLAHVSLVARRGADNFRGLGTTDAPGTTLVTVSGAVARGGVHEVPLGTPVSSLLAMAGAADRPAAVLLGGYGGSWLAPDRFDTPFDPGSLRAHGATTGAGVVVVLPSGACGLMETARIATWMASESAGQCGPCVFGLPAVAHDMTVLAAGRPNGRDFDRLEARLASVDGRGACRHPDGVVRMIRSALSAFATDIERHLAAGPCAGTRSPSVIRLPRP